MVHGLLNISTAKSYVPYQVLENKQMLYEMLNQPDRFLENIRRYSNALTTTMVYGWRTPTYEDENMKQLFEGFNEFAALNQTGTAALIDFFPWLRKLPDFMLPAQKKAKELHKHEKALYLGHWLKAKTNGRRESYSLAFVLEWQKRRKQTVSATTRQPTWPVLSLRQDRIPPQVHCMPLSRRCYCFRISRRELKERSIGL
jgi:hypothetical protein